MEEITGQGQDQGHGLTTEDLASPVSPATREEATAVAMDAAQPRAVGTAAAVGGPAAGQGVTDPFSPTSEPPGTTAGGASSPGTPDPPSRSCERDTPPWPSGSVAEAWAGQAASTEQARAAAQRASP